MSNSFPIPIPSSETAISSHLNLLKKHGIDLGPASGEVKDAGHSGRSQAFQNGTIFWHAKTGAHAVRGEMLSRYLECGGPRANPSTNERELGFPNSDHKRTEDGCYECVTFEWGMIVKVKGASLVKINGLIYTAWLKEGGAIGSLGHPLTDVFEVGEGKAAWFEGGVLWHAHSSQQVLVGALRPDTLGNPRLVDVMAPGNLPWVTFTGAVSELDSRPGLAAALFEDRLALQQVGGVDLIELHPNPVSSEGSTRSLSLRIHGYKRKRFAADVFSVINKTPTLISRTLYSLTYNTPYGPRVIAPHCLYARSDWKTFNIAHITDLHVSRRIEKYRTRLREGGIAEENIAKLNHWNDNFRAFIRYANELHRDGKLDAVIATGDLVDYAREYNDHPNGPGNFGLFEALIRGEAPSRDKESPSSEPLKVPIFTSLGNHDYRDLPYPLAFEIAVETADVGGEIPGIGGAIEWALDTAGDVLEKFEIPDPVGYVFDYFSNDVTKNFEGLNILMNEAIAIMGYKTDRGYAVPKLRPDIVAPSIMVNTRMKDRSHYYYKRINRQRSYNIQFGGTCVVMLDTKWDHDLPQNMTDMVLALKLGIGSESRLNLVGGAPDSEGVDDDGIELVHTAISRAGKNAVIVAMHAPPMNPAKTDLSNVLREMVRPTTSKEQIRAWLRRNELPENSPGWSMKGTAHFHQGPIEDGLDYATAVGNQEALAEILCGENGSRGVTLVCSGHGHTRVEYRLKQEDSSTGKLLAFTDHYLANPSVYYPSKLAEGSVDQRFLVKVEHGAPLGGNQVERSDFNGTIWEGTKELVVAPFANPLEQTTDPAGWWQQYAPVVTQTAALGPCTNSRMNKEVNGNAPGPNFQGLRLLHLDDGCITKVDYVSIDEVRAVAASAPPFTLAPSTKPVVGIFDPNANTTQPPNTEPPAPNPAPNSLPARHVVLPGTFENQTPKRKSSLFGKFISRKGKAVH